MLMEKLIELDMKLFTLLNGWHSDFCDPIMVFLSKVWVWIPLYLGVLVYLFFTKKWKVALLAVATIVLAYLASEHISVFIKESVARLRPCEEPLLANSVRMLEPHGSLYGFVSGHACNTFCFAALSSLIIRKKIYSILIFTWAAMVSYSRIYVGKHYPADIIGGALLGLLIAYLVWLIYKTILRKTCS
jgi:undecaprenyl-diphosphatase